MQCWIASFSFMFLFEFHSNYYEQHSTVVNLTKFSDNSVDLFTSILSEWKSQDLQSLIP